MALTVPRYSVSDLEHFPNDGNRYELLDGNLLVTPAPTFAHQAIALRIAMAFAELQANGHMQVVAPGAVVFPPGTHLEPDVLVIPPVASLDVSWQDIHEHWLAVDVLSPSSRVYDREFKRDAYFALGIREVWLVDIRDKSVEVCHARGAGTIMRDAVAWTAPDRSSSLRVELSELFAGVE
ncbi:MAG: Uma2 family endonuclease [bacterium]